jgi:hypothetical protein
METVHLIGKFNERPKRNALTSVVPRRLADRRSSTSADTAAALARLALRLPPLWHVDGTSAALPAFQAGEGQPKSH